MPSIYDDLLPVAASPGGSIYDDLLPTAPPLRTPPRLPDPVLPEFRRRLREMGNPEWATLDAPQAQAWFDRQGGTTGPQQLLSPEEHIAAAQKANSTLDALGRGFWDAVGLGEGQDSTATAYMSAGTPSLGPVGRAGGAVVSTGLEGLDYAFGGLSRLGGQAASGKPLNLEDALYPAFAKEHVPGIGEAIAEYSPMDERFVEQYGPDGAAALAALSGLAGEVMTDPEFTLGAGALGKAGAARRASSAARRRLATPEAQRARDLTDAADARATWEEGEGQRKMPGARPRPSPGPRRPG